MISLEALSFIQCYDYTLFFLESQARCQVLEETISKTQSALIAKESELSEVKRQLGTEAAGQVGKVDNSQKLLSDKESEIMSLRKEKTSLSEDLSKAQKLIAESRESVNLKAQEASRCQEELQKSSQTVKVLEEKLKNLQKESECQRHNAESVKGSLEKKLKDQVCKKNN